MITEVDFGNTKQVAMLSDCLANWPTDKLTLWASRSNGRGMYIDRKSFLEAGMGRGYAGIIFVPVTCGTEQRKFCLIESFFANNVDARDAILDKLCEEFDEIWIEFDLVSKYANAFHTFITQMKFVCESCPSVDNFIPRGRLVLRT